MNTFTLIFFIIITLDTSLKFYLNHRQALAIKKSFDLVPAAFAEQVALAAHQQAGRYTLAKLKLHHWELIFTLATSLAFTFGGGIDYLSMLCHINGYPLSSDVSLVIAYGLSSAVLSLPFNYYRTFKLEQEFGFNHATLKIFINDLLRSLLLSLIIATPLLYLIMYTMLTINPWWLWVSVVLIAFNLLILIIYPVLIAPWFNKFTPLADAQLNDSITQLLTHCQFKSKGVFIMDGSKRSGHGNAYFTGLSKSKRIVFFDTLLKQLNHNEIIAVLAHELGHFKHNHILKQLMLIFGLTLLGSYGLYCLIDQTWFYHGLNVNQISHGSGLILASILINFINLPLAPLINYLARNNEFEADNFAKQNTNPIDLITGLVKLYRDNASTLTPDAVYVKFYYSHPPASIRIANLEQ